MKFFLSNSEDLIDPEYNFLNGEYHVGRDRWRDDIYPHQLFSEPICDGVFLSGVARPSLKKRIAAEGGVHNFLRLPTNFPVMGDCNAFKYKDKDLPPYKTEEVVAIYQQHGYTHGVSVDHMIVPPLSPDEKQKRWNITIQNAQDFINEHSSARCTFVPVGVAQGWDPPSYRQAIEKLLEFGYKYIAIGGITRLHIKYLKPILEEVSAILPTGVDLHLLGTAKLSDLSLFQHSGVTSLNGSTPIRQGTRGGEYWTLENKKYAAIRIPLARGKHRHYHSSGNLKRLDEIREKSEGSEKELINMEQACLSLLRAYDSGKASLDDALSAILQYNQLNGLEDRRIKYERTLYDRPWQSCYCEICRSIGVEVIIFRDNNRNRRRGFHNAWVFYRQFRTALAAGMLER